MPVSFEPLAVWGSTPAGYPIEAADGSDLWGIAGPGLPANRFIGANGRSVFGIHKSSGEAYYNSEGVEPGDEVRIVQRESSEIVAIPTVGG